ADRGLPAEPAQQPDQLRGDPLALPAHRAGRGHHSRGLAQCTTQTGGGMSTIVSRRPPLSRFLSKDVARRYGIFIFFVLLVLLSGVISPTVLRTDNVLNMLVQFAPLGIVVIGQVFVILVGGLDLSVASVMATAAVIATAFDGTNASAPAIFGATFVMCLCAGLLNGLLVTKRQVSPFLATFATAVVLQGIRFAYTQGSPSGNVPPLFHT